MPPEPSLAERVQVGHIYVLDSYDYNALVDAGFTLEYKWFFAFERRHGPEYLHVVIVTARPETSR